MTKTIATIVGARPQFIKLSPVSKAVRQAGLVEKLIHTGQHYDDSMSATFFRDLDIPAPDFNLQIGSGTHGQQTGNMLIAIEEILMRIMPDLVIVYGDTNSTIAGALAAVKLNIEVAHIEAGLRSFNRSMPEEHNRILTDHCSNYLFCPTDNAVQQLEQEGIQQNVFMVGDTMYDAVVQYTEKAQKQSTILEKLRLIPCEYFLVTIHRPVNADDPNNLKSLLHALNELGMPVVFPVHPRTQKKIAELDEGILGDHIVFIDPMGYLDMLVLQRNARKILTDSGGIQKEAYFLGVPCITLRTETEWVETVESGWNRLVGANPALIIDSALNWNPAGSTPPTVFGEGFAADKIVTILMDKLTRS